MCDQNIYPVNSISASIEVDLSTINVHYFLHFLGEIIFICMATNKFKNILNLVSVTMA